MEKKDWRALAVRTKGVLQPTHPRWNEFLQKLAGPDGCNFVENEGGGATWRCKGGKDKSLAIAIMQKMGDVDLERSLDYFETHGGYCDCEILFNVA